MKIKRIIQYCKIKYLRNRIIYHRYKILQKKYNDLLVEYEKTNKKLTIKNNNIK